MNIEIRLSLENGSFTSPHPLSSSFQKKLITDLSFWIKNYDKNVMNENWNSCPTPLILSIEPQRKLGYFQGNKSRNIQNCIPEYFQYELRHLF
jgi:hypothetical protein